MDAIVKVHDLFLAGAHYGHSKSKLHPGMAPYIFTEREGISLIDLGQTSRQLNEAYKKVKALVVAGGSILFVGTQKVARKTIKECALSVNMPSVTDAWNSGAVSGFLNFYQHSETPELTEKATASYAGPEGLATALHLVFVAGVDYHLAAIQECKERGVPVIAVADSNSNPAFIDLVIPANDDGFRSIRLIAGVITEAIRDGQIMRHGTVLSQEAVSKRVRNNWLIPGLMAKQEKPPLAESADYWDDLRSLIEDEFDMSDIKDDEMYPRQPLHIEFPKRCEIGEPVLLTVHADLDQLQMHKLLLQERSSKSQLVVLVSARTFYVVERLQILDIDKFASQLMARFELKAEEFGTQVIELEFFLGSRRIAYAVVETEVLNSVRQRKLRHVDRPHSAKVDLLERELAYEYSPAVTMAIEQAHEDLFEYYFSAARELQVG